MKTLSSKESEAIHNDLRRFHWYHQIEIGHGFFTEPPTVKSGDTFQNNSWLGTWKSNSDMLPDLWGKSVLDVGCRDGKFAFESERKGASRIVAVDNDISEAGRALAVHVESIVEFKHANIYSFCFDPPFDFVLAFGLLYHLRLPVLGLKRLCDLCLPGGRIFIETAICDEPSWPAFPILYCPVLSSPYEASSCTFFTCAGLVETMSSLGCTLVSSKAIGFSTTTKPRITRYAFVFTKDSKPLLEDYWYGLHSRHTNQQHNPLL